MHINCIKCGTSTSIENNIEIKTFGCLECKSLFYFKNNELIPKEKYNYTSIVPLLKIGQKGIIEDVEYEIIAIIIKRVYQTFYWREYTLKAKDDTYRYLSESDGHWILLEEVPDEYDISKKFQTLTHNSITYNLYEYTDAIIVGAYGFFDDAISKSTIQMAEYIKPPFIVSIEEFNNKQTTYFGRHFSKAEVKKAFTDQDLPLKSGVGAVQPFLFNFSNTAIVFCCVAILILITQIFVNQNRTETHVLSKNFAFSDYVGKDYVSESFTLEGGSAPMTISIHSDVNNSWANAQVALVNEKTNEEEYANKDLEYYHGYEGGESWSEGSQGEKFNICGVAEGKYHLVITPQKQPDSSNEVLSVNVVWKEPSMWNFFISALAMGITLLILFFANKNFEQRRWESSDYSPFE